jgi:hypothetical protein
MTRRVVAIVAALLAFGLAWVLVPPFPSPDLLLNTPLPELTKRFGVPRAAAPQQIAGSLDAVKAVAWDRSRLVATWTLQADWVRWHGRDPAAHPDSLLRCLRWAPPINILAPCDGAYTAQVMASNNRWRDP